MKASRGRLPLRAATGVILAACIAAGSPVRAQVAPPYATLLQETANAPRLAESQALIRRAEGLSTQARARPNPTVSMQTENVGGTAQYRRFDQAETTVQVSQPLEFWGKRSARIAAGEAGVSASKARDRDTRVAYAYDLAIAYAEAEATDRRIDLAKDQLEKATNDLRAARALVDAGKETRLRSLQAESGVNQATSNLELAKAERIAAYARLSAMAGATTPYATVAESVLDIANAPISAFGNNPLTSPAFLAAERERDAASRRLEVERKRAIPDVTANVGMRRFQADRANAIVGGISIPFPLFDANRGNIAASRAELQAADARVEMARNEVMAASQAAVAEVAAATSRFEAAQNALATAEETYRLARIAYDAGKSPLVELLAAQQGLALSRGLFLDARLSQFDVRARLARLSGRAITGEEIP